MESILIDSEAAAFLLREGVGYSLGRKTYMPGLIDDLARVIAPHVEPGERGDLVKLIRESGQTTPQPPHADLAETWSRLASYLEGLDQRWERDPVELPSRDVSLLLSLVIRRAAGRSREEQSEAIEQISRQWPSLPRSEQIGLLRECSSHLPDTARHDPDWAGRLASFVDQRLADAQRRASGRATAAS